MAAEQPGTWWRETGGGRPVRVQRHVTERVPRCVVVVGIGKAGRTLEQREIDADVFRRRFVPAGPGR